MLATIARSHAQDAARRARGAQLLEPRADDSLPRARRPAVDQREAIVDVQQQRVAVECLQRLEREDHAQTAWIARRASSCRAWK